MDDQYRVPDYGSPSDDQAASEPSASPLFPAPATPSPQSQPWQTSPLAPQPPAYAPPPPPPPQQPSQQAQTGPMSGYPSSGPLQPGQGYYPQSGPLPQQPGYYPPSGPLQQQGYYPQSGPLPQQYPGYYQPPQPIVMVPPVVVQSDNGTLAIILEVIAGLFGLYGIGWLVGGFNDTGVKILVGGLIWWIAAIFISVFTLGIGLLCIWPVDLIIMIVSVINLSNRLKQRKMGMIP